MDCFAALAMTLREQAGVRRADWKRSRPPALPRNGGLRLIGPRVARTRELQSALRAPDCLNVIARSACNEAIHSCFLACCAMDCFAALAMTLREQAVVRRAGWRRSRNPPLRGASADYAPSCRASRGPVGAPTTGPSCQSAAGILFLFLRNCACRLAKSVLCSRHPVPSKGAFRESSQTRGGLWWTRKVLFDVEHLTRTEKTCGPDARSRHQVRGEAAAGDGDKPGARAGESTI